MFSLTYKYKETAYTIFSTRPTFPIINNYYNVHPHPYSNPSYYSELESNQMFEFFIRNDLISQNQLVSNQAILV